MQAQSYPPERPSNSSHPSHRQNGRGETSLPPRHQGNRKRVSSEVRAAASGGDFRAIATILNSILNPHDISAWVGEAGPGYLQITLTVKRPPKRKPLVRLVSHQLYSLQSDVVLGANLTVQVTQTNLILWNQLVRLPLPDIYKQPSKWDVWLAQAKEWKTEAGVQALATWTQSQQTVKAWYEKRRLQDGAVPSTQPPQVPSPGAVHPTHLSAAIPHTITHPSQPLDSSFSVAENGAETNNGTNQASTDSDLGATATYASSVPSEILQQAQQHAQNVAQAQDQQQPQANNYPNDNQPLNNQPLSNQGIENQQWSAMAMVPGVVMVPPAPPANANTAASAVGSSMGVGITPNNITVEENPTANHVPAIGGGGGGFGSGFGTLRAKAVHQVMNPSPWMLGGAAIAAFLVGSTLVESISSTSGEAQDSRPVATEQTLPNVTMAPSNTNQPEAEQGGLSNRSGGLINTLPNRSTSTSSDTTNVETTGPSVRPTNRPKTVEMHDQTINVVPLMPTTANFSEVTLTFSGNAIVPLPPPEAEKPKGWRSLFSSASAPPSHPADIAMALINQPLGQSPNGTSTLTPQTLHQGGIDVVNIAGNDLAKSQSPSLRDTVSLLSQSAIRTVGAGLTEEKASRPQIFDVKGHRIAVLGYVDTHLYAADREMAGNNPGSRRRLAADIEAVRDQVDWIIVSYHWSDVETSEPSDQQVRLAHLAVDQGADLVVGYHPEMIQGGEVYNGRAIAYSLGQMPSDAPQAPLASSQDHSPSEATAADGNVMDNVPHQLPDSGIRTTPTRSDETSEMASNAEAASPTMSAMLKVVLGDRHMGIEFIPVQTHSGTSEFAQKKEGQTVLRTLKEASRTFDDPLTLNGMAHLPLTQNIRAFSNSAEESFQPDRTDGFIDRAE